VSHSSPTTAQAADPTPSAPPLGEAPPTTLLTLRATVVSARELGLRGPLPEFDSYDLQEPPYLTRKVPRATADRVLERIVAELGPRCGLAIGQSLTESHYHFAGPLLMSQVTARRAIELLLLMARRFEIGVGLRLGVQGEEARVEIWPSARGVPGRMVGDLTLALAYHSALRFWGAWVHRSLRVECTLAPDQHQHDYQRMFGSTVRFRAPANALVFPEALLDYTRPGADPELAARLSAYAHERYLHEQGDVSWAQRVRSALLQAGSAVELELAGVAGALRVSTRTLRRRLLEEGTSFSQMREEVRLSRAAELLVSGQDSLGTIARIVGYSEVNAFRRAFRKWSGRTPSAYRSGRADD
jgi:AraC-like DNA-binding protein